MCNSFLMFIGKSYSTLMRLVDLSIFMMVEFGKYAPGVPLSPCESALRSYEVRVDKSFDRTLQGRYTMGGTLLTLLHSRQNKNSNGISLVSLPFSIPMGVMCGSGPTGKGYNKTTGTLTAYNICRLWANRRNLIFLTHCTT